MTVFEKLGCGVYFQCDKVFMHGKTGISVKYSFETGRTDAAMERYFVYAHIRVDFCIHIIYRLRKDKGVGSG